MIYSTASRKNAEELIKFITYPKLLIFKALIDSEPIGGIEYSDLLGFMKYHIRGFNDGKLMHHLKMMENLKMVKISKDKFRNDVRTVVSITDKGKNAFEEMLELLKRNVMGVDSNE